MEEIVQAFLEQLGRNIPGLPADEDRGQFDHYGDTPPAEFPYALVDVREGEFTEDGQRRQKGVLTVVVRLFVLNMDATDEETPQSRKEQAAKGWQMYGDIDRALHGQDFLPGGFGTPVRLGMERVRREDGIYERAMTYAVGISDDSCVPVRRRTSATPKITASLIRE